MKVIPLISVAVLTFIACVMPPRCLVRGQTAISCYNCTATTSTDNCAVVDNNTPTINTCGTCYTVANVGAAGYNRMCTPFPQVITPPTCNGVSGSTCYCSGDKCNKQVFTTLGNVKCYVCQSSNGIDNGCAETLKSDSSNVQQVSGCTACTKSTSATGYARGCSHALETGDSCTQTTTPSCSFRCTKDLCNSARPGTTSGAPLCLAALLAAFALLSAQRNGLDILLGARNAH